MIDYLGRSTLKLVCWFAGLLVCWFAGLLVCLVGKNVKMYKLICLIALGAIVMSLSLFAARDTPHTSRLLNGEFQNSEIVFHSSLADMWNIVKQSWQAKRAEPVPTKIIPVESITTVNLLKQTNDVLYRLGHSTLLIKLHSKFILIDPIFSERASPVQWAGPKAVL